MEKSLALLLDLYELTMGESYFHYKSGQLATFDLFVREMPAHRRYLVAAGLEDILLYISRLRFDRADLGYLKSRKIFSADFLEYLKDFRFRGDIWAMPEGTVFFPGEPVVRVTAPIIQAQIIESFLLNTINLQTMIASKASRVVSAARGKGVYDFSLRRTHGRDAGIKAARCSYIAGCRGSSCVLAGKLYQIPVAGTMAHSFIMSFKQELDSFLAYSTTFPDKTILLVDTYNTKKGIKNAVTIGLYLKDSGHRLQGIRLDSGDIVSLSKFARKALDKAGLRFVKIFASGNLDEYRIKAILARGGCVDNFGVGTHMGASIDAPSLDVIYKISEVTDEEGKFLPAMKLSKDKVTYPGRKQVFRVSDRRGRFVKDILGLEDEKISARPLLKKVVSGGRVIYNLPSLDRTRAYLSKSLSCFAGRLKELYSPYKYPVIVSRKLEKLKQNLSSQLETKQ